MFLLAEEQSELLTDRDSGTVAGGGVPGRAAGAGGCYSRSMSASPDGVAVSIVGGVFKWSKVVDDSDKPEEGKGKGKGKGKQGSPELEKEKEEGCLEVLKPKCCKNKKKEDEWWEVDGPEVTSSINTAASAAVPLAAC